MTFVRAGLGVLLAGCLLCLAPLTSAPTEAADRRLAADRPPNVVLIYADDMRLDELAYMPRTARLFEEEGLTFTNAVSPHPLCCPARAELMTGQYAQNNGVHHNRGPWGGYPALTSRRRLTPQWFRRAGYATAYVGKYLNGYRGGSIKGATVTDTLVKRIYMPVRFRTWNNGRTKRRRGHQTDWTRRRTQQLIRHWRDRPFFIMTSYLAPHDMHRKGSWGPPVPPARFNQFRPGDADPPYLDHPAYNEADVSDKPAWLDRPPQPDARIARWHRARVLSLYALDQAVMRTVRSLKRAGVYRDTIIAFTSDNGYALGEHRMRGKNLPYEPVLRVPLLMTGPGVPHGRDTDVATLVDLPGTLAGLAGVTPMREVDGVDLLESHPDRAVLVQAGSEQTEWAWRGVFTRRYTYVEHVTGEAELYDRASDPYELRSAHDDPGHAAVRTQLAALRARLVDCAGTACTATWSPGSAG